MSVYCVLVSINTKPSETCYKYLSGAKKRKLRKQQTEAVLNLTLQVGMTTMASESVSEDKNNPNLNDFHSWPVKNECTRIVQ